jgi:hypothetical protein
VGPPPHEAARSAAAVHVEVVLDLAAAAFDPAADDLLPAARAFLERRGFWAALEAVEAVLLVRELPPDPAAEAAARLEAAAAASALRREFGRCAAAPGSARWSICLHAGPWNAGDPVPGDVLDLAAWVPDEAPSGAVLITEAARAGLDVPLVPLQAQGALFVLGDLVEAVGSVLPSVDAVPAEQLAEVCPVHACGPGGGGEVP